RVRDGYVVTGQKSFINNGHLHDFAIVAVRTAVERPLGLSLLLVERSRPGYSAGPVLRKLGLHAQDTAELYFDDVFVPQENLIGREGAAFAYIMEAMKRERLAIALSCLYLAESCLEETIA